MVRIPDFFHPGHLVLTPVYGNPENVLPIFSCVLGSAAAAMDFPSTS